jgi:hypothetical protein
MDKATFTAAYEAALAEARANPTAQAREAAKQASAALSAWVIANEPAKGPGPLKHRGNAAGKRQYRELLARHRIKL